MVDPEDVRQRHVRVHRHAELRLDLEPLPHEAGQRLLQIRSEADRLGYPAQRPENARRGAVEWHLDAERETSRILRPGALHRDAPGRRVGVTGVDEPSPIAAEDVEDRVQRVARELLEIVGALDGAVHAVQVLEKGEVSLALLLGAEAIADVARDADRADDLATGVSIDVPRRQERAHRAPDLDRLLERLRDARRRHTRLVLSRAFGRVEREQERPASPDELVWRLAEQARSRRVDHQHPPGQIFDEDDVGRGVEDGGEQIGELVLADVRHEAAHHEGSIRPRDGARDVADPDAVPVRRDPPVLEVELSPALGGVHETLDGARAIFGVQVITPCPRRETRERVAEQALDVLTHEGEGERLGVRLPYDGLEVGYQFSLCLIVHGRSVKETHATRSRRRPRCR
jgi:hypothetical protein